jgi:hypothetical protein
MGQGERVARSRTAVTGPLRSEKIIRVEVDRCNEPWQDEPLEIDIESFMFRATHDRPSHRAVWWEVERHLRAITECEPVDNGYQSGRITVPTDGLEDEEETGSARLKLSCRRHGGIVGDSRSGPSRPHWH